MSNKKVSVLITKQNFNLNNDVLLRNDYFNEFIGCKIHSKFIKEMKNDYFKRTDK